MVTCPKCNKSLPDWAQTCQFCNADVKAVPRPIVEERKLNYYEPAKWAWVAYYLIAAYWMLGGIVDIVVGLMPKGGVLDVVSGAISLILGLGLTLRLEFVRGFVNFFCALQILFGLLGLAASLFTVVILGPFTFLLMALNVFNILTAGLMIYLIGETDRGVNF